MTQALHSSSVSAEDGSIVYTGELAGFVLTIDSGYKVYFAGDTTVFGDMSLIGESRPRPPCCRSATSSPWAGGGGKAVELLGVRRVLGMHYGTFPVLLGTPQQLREAVPRGVWT
jgi:L-ascorbate metabolism protein UlaG (beta-lactamase superfamily)